MKIIIAAVSVLVSISPAWGGTVQGKVAQLISRDDGLQYVVVAGTPAGRPTCAAGTTYYMIRDENSRYGQSQFAMLLSAKLAGAVVKISGSNGCTRWQDGEDISILELTP